MQCHYCEKRTEALPFRCNYCAEYFCTAHRLPENHACPRVGAPKQPGYAKIPSTSRGYRRARENSNLPTIRSSRFRFGLRYSGLFTKTERKHILLAIALVSLVGLSMLEPYPGFGSDLLIVPFFIGGFVLSFLGHELAHKFLAQANGLWAEFRTNLYGSLMTVVSIVLPFKFIAPGVVSIAGNGSKQAMGPVALVGPAFNLVLGWISFLVSRALVGDVGQGLAVLAAFNGWMAAINLIPWGMFDGANVYQWDKLRWAISIAAGVGLIITGYLR